jgi:hypothetical protein
MLNTNELDTTNNAYYYTIKNHFNNTSIGATSKGGVEMSSSVDGNTKWAKIGKSHTFTNWDKQTENYDLFLNKDTEKYLSVNFARNDELELSDTASSCN